MYSQERSLENFPINASSDKHIQGINLSKTDLFNRSDTTGLLFKKNRNSNETMQFRTKNDPIMMSDGFTIKKIGVSPPKIDRAAKHVLIDNQSEEPRSKTL